MERMLDRSRDYGIVHGGDVPMFEQDGMMFLANGRLAGDPPAAPPPVEVATATPPDDDMLLDMDGTELKALIESYGGTWKDRDTAVRFIRGQRS